MSVYRAQRARWACGTTAQRIRRESYSSLDDLDAAIYDYLLLHNAKPKPFVWSKTTDDIIARKRRALNAIDKISGNRQNASGVKH